MKTFWITLLGIILVQSGASRGAELASFDFDTLVSRLQAPENKILTIEEFLPTLPENLRAQYVLVYESQSLQDASINHPRVILFNDDASLIISFNGDPAQSGFSKLEVIQFRQAKQQFEFIEIRFPQGQPNRKVEVSPINPSKCLACHGSNPRPNWDSYPFWPGVYGSEDDHIFRSQSYDVPPYRVSPYEIDQKEELDYDQFLLTSRRQGRYAHLLTPVTRYFGETHVAIPEAERLAHDESIRNGAKPTKLSPRTNLDFNSAIATLNYKRIAREVLSDSRFLAWRYALSGIMACSTDRGQVNPAYEISQWVPAVIAQTFPRTHSELILDTQKLQMDGLDLRFARHQALIGRGPVTNRIKDLRSAIEWPYEIAGLRFVIEGLGGTTTDWSLQFSPRSYVFFSGLANFKSSYGSAFSSLVDTFLAEAEASDLQPWPTKMSHDELCNFLLKKNKEELDWAF